MRKRLARQKSTRGEKNSFDIDIITITNSEWNMRKIAWTKSRHDAIKKWANSPLIKCKVQTQLIEIASCFLIQSSQQIVYDESINSFLPTQHSHFKFCSGERSEKLTIIFPSSLFLAPNTHPPHPHARHLTLSRETTRAKHPNRFINGYG